MLKYDQLQVWRQQFKAEHNGKEPFVWIDKVPTLALTVSLDRSMLTKFSTVYTCDNTCKAGSGPTMFQTHPLNCHAVLYRSDTARGVAALPARVSREL